MSPSRRSAKPSTPPVMCSPSASCSSRWRREPPFPWRRPARAAARPGPRSRWHPLRYSAAFARVVARCRKKDPARRYSSAIELQRDLDDVSGSEAAAGRSPRGRFGTSALVAAAVTIVLATAGAASWWFARRAASERAHQAAVEEVEQLVNAGEYVDVWRLASDGLRRWPDDARLAARDADVDRCRHDCDKMHRAQR